MSAEKPAVRSNAPKATAEGGPREFLDHKDDIFFAAIETTRMPMLVTDPRQPDNPIVFLNRAFASMSGYSSAEVLGRNCRFLQGPATDAQSVAAIREAVAAKREISLEILNYKKDGSTFWNALFVSPVYNPAGELIYFFASQLDVSRRRDAEEALNQAQKMEALGQLTGGIAHDFNNLLQVMAGHLDLLRARARSGALAPPDLDRGLSTVREAVTKAGSLTQQLLAYSRKQTLNKRVINVNAVVAATLDGLRSALAPGIEIALEAAEALANCDLDSVQLDSALTNLVINARDAMPQGGRIDVKTSQVMVGREGLKGVPKLRPGSYVCIGVSDDGEGIPHDVINRVMDPFFTTKDVGKGTGLGLSMVYGFVKQSGGLATIYSELGIGTTVRMYFPAVDAPASADARQPERADQPVGSEVILVVEDRPELAALARECLVTLGYTVHVTSSAVEALALVDTLSPREMPALVFSDVVMPGGMNGYSLAKELRARHPGMCVLLTSGFDRAIGNVGERSSDDFELIKKPYQLDELARRVRRILDSSPPERTERGSVSGSWP